MSTDDPDPVGHLDDSECRERLADLEFRGPHEQCVAAILAARRFVYVNNGATWMEIVEELVPAENHPIGLNAELVHLRLGGYDYFRRRWWRDVVEPGLRELRDVEPPNAGSSRWHPRR